MALGCTGDLPNRDPYPAGTRQRRDAALLPPPARTRPKTALEGAKLPLQVDI